MLTEVIEWFERARRLVPAEDRKVLLNPPRLAARFARFAMRRARETAGRITADEVEAAMQTEMDRITLGRRWLLGQRITQPPDATAIPPREIPAAHDRAGRDEAAIRASSSR